MKINPASPFKSAGAGWYLFSLLLSIGYLLLIFADIGTTGFSRIYFNSDMLYDPVIFRDLFVDDTGLNGWHLNAAPNFFPDMFFYFIINALTGDFVAANFFFSIGQFLTILLLGLWLIRQIGREHTFRYATAFNFLMFLFLLLPVYAERFRLMFQLISISYHMGSYIMFLLSLNLLTDYLRRKRTSTLILLFLSVMIATFNDRLFVSQFVIAILPLAVLLYQRDHRKQILKPLVSVVIATVAGLLFFKLVRLYNPVHIIGTGFKMFNFDNLAESWAVFTGYMATLFMDGWGERLVQLIFLLSFILGLLYIWHSRKIIFAPPAADPGRELTAQEHPGMNEAGMYRQYLVIILTAYLPVTLLVPVINGGFVSPSLIRFNIMAFFTGLLMLPLLMSAWPQPLKIVHRALAYLVPVVGLVFVVIFTWTAARVSPVDGLKQYFHFYPERVEVLDSLQVEYDLQYGIGNYWDAKYITMLSHEGVRLYTVFDGSLRPFYHSTNENWYHSGGKGKHKDPVFNYAVRKMHADNSKLLEIFGNGADTIYRDPADQYYVLKLPDFIIDRETREIEIVE